MYRTAGTPENTRTSPPSSWRAAGRRSPSPSTRPAATGSPTSCGPPDCERGDHISVFMENQPPHARDRGRRRSATGLYFTLVNAYLAADEVAYIVNNSRSRLFFSSVGQAGRGRARPRRPARQLERLLMVGTRRPVRALGAVRSRRRGLAGRSGTGREARRTPCSTRPARPASPRASCVACPTWPRDGALRSWTS